MFYVKVSATENFAAGFFLYVMLHKMFQLKLFYSHALTNCGYIELSEIFQRFRLKNNSIAYRIKNKSVKSGALSLKILRKTLSFTRGN